MGTLLRGVLAVGALGCCALGWATGPAGGSYVIISSTIASGTPGMTGGAHAVTASLGDLSRAPALAGGTYQLYPGFWTPAGAVIAPTCLLDLDGNGVRDALTDGLMLLRAMFGLTGTAVTSGAIGANAQYTTWAQIEPRINYPALDIDNNGHTDALTDGLLIIRAMFGLTGTAVSNGAIGVGAQRTNWAQLRDYLNNSCGASFAP